VATFAELALFSVLFTDGMKVGLRELAAAWHLPGRALLLGLPLTLLGTAVIARWVVGLPWAESLLLGAILSPTTLDPARNPATRKSTAVERTLRSARSDNSTAARSVSAKTRTTIMGEILNSWDTIPYVSFEV